MLRGACCPGICMWGRVSYQCRALLLPDPDILQSDIRGQVGPRLVTIFCALFCLVLVPVLALVPNPPILPPPHPHHTTPHHVQSMSRIIANTILRFFGSGTAPYFLFFMLEYPTKFYSAMNLRSDKVYLLSIIIW